jgi:hypothetical protein
LTGSRAFENGMVELRYEIQRNGAVPEIDARP